MHWEETGREFVNGTRGDTVHENSHAKRRTDHTVSDCAKLPNIENRPRDREADELHSDCEANER